jgi:hypothetical protein
MTRPDQFRHDTMTRPPVPDLTQNAIGATVITGYETSQADSLVITIDPVKQYGSAFDVSDDQVLPDPSWFAADSKDEDLNRPIMPEEMNAKLAEDARTHGEAFLAEYRDAMVSGLVTKHGVEAEHAELMVDQLWSRLTNRLASDYEHMGVDMGKAQRIMNETLGFLKLCSVSHGHGPSPTVDLGWHTFILYSLEYDAFCEAVAGAYLHHAPTDIIGLNTQTGADCSPHPCSSRDCTNGPSSVVDGVDEAFPDGVCFAPGKDKTRPFTLRDTVAAMKRLGPVDLELWSAEV